MRCERCQFENIPGQKTCIRCGSVLEVSRSAVDVHPPRMAKWKKPFRSFSRLLRKGKVIREKRVGAGGPSALRKVFDSSFTGLLLSIIPGMGHLFQGKFREIKWYFLAWVIFFATGIFFLGSGIGFIILGLAVGVHAGIAIQILFKNSEVDPKEKITACIIIFIALLLIYRFSPRLTRLSGHHSSLAVPFYQIEEGDYLLTWNELSFKSFYDRSSLVVMKPTRFSSYGRLTEIRDRVIGQIVGLGGEKVEIKSGLYFVNGEMLDAGRYPVPNWLKGVELSTSVPDDSYFISAEYKLRGHGVELDPKFALNVCIVKTEAVEAKAFMRWWPFSKRGFIRYE